jgi:hypothetical protein
MWKEFVYIWRYVIKQNNSQRMRIDSVNSSMSVCVYILRAPYAAFTHTHTSSSYPFPTLSGVGTCFHHMIKIRQLFSRPPG